MDLIVHIPDEIIPSLQRSGSDLSRRVLEALALAEYRRGTLDKSDLGCMLGFESSNDTDHFLKERNAILGNSL